MASCDKAARSLSEVVKALTQARREYVDASHGPLGSRFRFEFTRRWILRRYCRNSLTRRLDSTQHLWHTQRPCALTGRSYANRSAACRYLDGAPDGDE